MYSTRGSLVPGGHLGLGLLAPDRGGCGTPDQLNLSLRGIAADVVGDGGADFLEPLGDQGAAIVGGKLQDQLGALGDGEDTNLSRESRQPLARPARRGASRGFTPDHKRVLQSAGWVAALMSDLVRACGEGLGGLRLGLKRAY